MRQVSLAGFGTFTSETRKERSGGNGPDYPLVRANPGAETLLS